MGYVQLPDELKAVVARHVAEGRAASEADFLAEAVRLYAGYLETDGEIAAMVARADADAAAGRYVLVSSPEDAEAVHQRTISRLRDTLARSAPRG